MPQFLKKYYRKRPSSTSAGSSTMNSTSYQKLESEPEVDDAISMSEVTILISNKSSREEDRKTHHHEDNKTSPIVNEGSNISSMQMVNDHVGSATLQNYRAPMSSSTTQLERVPLDDSNLHHLSEYEAYRLKSELNKSTKEKKKTERNLIKLAKQLQCQTDESKIKDVKIKELEAEINSFKLKTPQSQQQSNDKRETNDDDNNERSKIKRAIRIHRLSSILALISDLFFVYVIISVGYIVLKEKDAPQGYDFRFCLLFLIFDICLRVNLSWKVVTTLFH